MLAASLPGRYPAGPDSFLIVEISTCRASIKGPDIGASDYLMKPIRLNELLACRPHPDPPPLFPGSPARHSIRAQPVAGADRQSDGLAIGYAMRHGLDEASAVGQDLACSSAISIDSSR